LEVAVRRLSKEDLEGERLEELRRLWAELTSEYGGDELEYDGAAEEAWRRAMLASLGSDEARVLVAESREDGSILGYVFFVIFKMANLALQGGVKAFKLKSSFPSGCSPPVNFSEMRGGS